MSDIFRATFVWQFKVQLIAGSNLCTLRGWADHGDHWGSLRVRPYHCTSARLTLLITCGVRVSRGKIKVPTRGSSHCPHKKVITHGPNMGNRDGKHTSVSCGSHVGTLRGKTHGPHVGNCCTFQCSPLMAAHVWPIKVTHMGPSWVNGTLLSGLIIQLGEPQTYWTQWFYHLFQVLSYFRLPSSVKNDNPCRL